MKSWTRTLNLDDTHSLLAVSEPGLSRVAWTKKCHEVIPHLSVERRRELIRLVRDGFLEWTTSGDIEKGMFLSIYDCAPAMAQIDLVQHQWAMSHGLTLLAADQLVAPVLAHTDQNIPIHKVEALVKKHLDTSSEESLRKTRTVLLNAMEGVGAISTSGAGKHKSIKGSRGLPHPLTFAMLVQRELNDRKCDAMMLSEVLESSIAVRLTQCDKEHAEWCLRWSIQRSMLTEDGDEVGLPTS